MKPEIQLPWCGKVLDNRCQAVSFSYGLYTQCMNAPDNENKTCKTCAKYANEAGKPKFGFITDRAANPEWIAPDGKHPERFVQFWSKRLEPKGITREKVEAEAAKFGFVVPETEWINQEKTTRKRKEKTTIALSSASGSDDGTHASDAAAPAAKVKKLTKTKSSPASPPTPVTQPSSAHLTIPPAPIQLASHEDNASSEVPEHEDTTDMVHQSLSSGLTEDMYDTDSDEEDEVEELSVCMREIDHNDGKGPRNALLDANDNVYCYTAFIFDGSQKKVGTFTNGVFIPTA